MTRKILVIDDNAAVRDSTAVLLGAAGYDVALARDGIAGVAALREAQPDVVMCDIIMPDREGIETIRLILREHPNMKIIAMSGAKSMGNSDLLKIARQFGATHTLRKPFATEELLGLLSTIFA